MWVVADLDDDYIRKMEDVLEVYERPFDPQQPVVCLDEKPITLHADVRPGSPASPGREARQDNEYKRCGTANVFCAVEPKAGRHFTFATPDRSGFEFAQVAVTLALAYPDAQTIHLVMDNLNIHRRKSLVDVFGTKMAGEVWDRFTVHYTPTHGSWLNQAEIEIGLFSRQCLGKRRLASLKILKAESRAWNRRMNRNRVKIAWKFDRKAARKKFGYNFKFFKRSKTYALSGPKGHHDIGGFCSNPVASPWNTLIELRQRAVRGAIRCAASAGALETGRLTAGPDTVPASAGGAERRSARMSASKALEKLEPARKPGSGRSIRYSTPRSKAKI
jgi:hypothetical protein